MPVRHTAHQTSTHYEITFFLTAHFFSCFLSKVSGKQMGTVHLMSLYMLLVVVNSNVLVNKLLKDFMIMNVFNLDLCVKVDCPVSEVLFEYEQMSLFIIIPFVLVFLLLLLPALHLAFMSHASVLLLPQSSSDNTIDRLDCGQIVIFKSLKLAFCIAFNPLLWRFECDGSIVQVEVLLFEIYKIQLKYDREIHAYFMIFHLVYTIR